MYLSYIQIVGVQVEIVLRVRCCGFDDFLYQLSALAGPPALGLAIGGLSHVVLDMLTPQGIPLLPFTRRGRVSLKLCRTGGLGEWIFLAAMLAGLAFWFRESLNDRGLAATLKAMLGL